MFTRSLPMSRRLLALSISIRTAAALPEPWLSFLIRGTGLVALDVSGAVRVICTTDGRACVQGYELNPEEWIPYKLLAETVALEAWEARQKAIVEAWEADGAAEGAADGAGGLPCGRS